MKRLSFLLATMLLTSTAIQATAADSTNFNPNTMASVTAQVETPVGTIMPWAVDTAPPTMVGEVIWLPCDGQAIPSGVEYDELRTTLNSSTLPNLNNNQFLKGSTTEIGKQVAQSTVNTTVNIPDHKHDLTGGVAGGQTIVSGGAGGQSFSYKGPSGGGNSAYGSTSGGAIWGSTSASGLAGTTGLAGASTVTINDVATPAHVNVVYYIKVKN